MFLPGLYLVSGTFRPKYVAALRLSKPINVVSKTGIFNRRNALTQTRRRE